MEAVDFRLGLVERFVGEGAERPGEQSWSGLVSTTVKFGGGSAGTRGVGSVLFSVHAMSVLCGIIPTLVLPLGDDFNRPMHSKIETVTWR
jgi:hypothetical protein